MVSASHHETRNLLSTAFLMAFTSGRCLSDQYHRDLELEPIAGFQPMIQVTDHASIDLDVALIEDLLYTETQDGFDDAMRVYTEGAFSRSYAELSLDAGLPEHLNIGESLTGKSQSGETITAVALHPINQGKVKIQLEYLTSDNQTNYVGCQVGANPQPNLAGCFAERGEVYITENNVMLPYWYDPFKDNKNDRTVQRFSTLAYAKMKPCGKCDFYREFDKYVEYYGLAGFADHWIRNAFDGTREDLNVGIADFTKYTLKARAQAIMTGIVTMSIGHFVIRELGTAIHDCDTRQEEAALRTVDAAAAFYAGSLEGQIGTGNGKLYYAFADRMCAQFKTCGYLGDGSSGRSRVNHIVFDALNEMQDKLSVRDCATSHRNMENITHQMHVPLVQSMLRSSYIRWRTNKAAEGMNDIDLENYVMRNEVEVAVGDMIAASLLPKIAFCHYEDAKLISRLMYNHPHDGDFPTLKRTLEQSYDCLGITCEDVGGYWDGSGYYKDFQPCVTELLEDLDDDDEDDEDSKRGRRRALRLIMSTALILFITRCFCCPRRGKKKRHDDDDSLSDDSEDDDDNILS